MIRTATVACALLLGAGAAQALDARSTMADWSAAPAAERNAWLDRVGPGLSRTFQADRPAIVACMNLAGQAPAHAAFPLAEIAKACVDGLKPDGGANPSTDI